MSSKLNNIQKLQNQIKSLKGQLKSRNNYQNSTVRRTNAPVNTDTSWTGSSKPLRVRQSERIATITASPNAGDFEVSKFVINPADGTTFPWLASIAQLFDKYKFHELKFRFINYVSTVTNGNVSMAVDFDTLDPTPTSSVEMSNLAKFCTFSPWKVEELTIPTLRRGNRQWYFCSDSNSESGTNVDLKTYNLGNFYVSSEGLSANQVIGYIVADYDVEFLDKNPPSVTESVLDNDFAILTSETGAEASSGIVATYNVGTATFTISGLKSGDEYVISYYDKMSPAAANSSSGFSLKSGESFSNLTTSATSHQLLGVITPSVDTISITHGTTTTISYYLSIAKI